MASEIAIRRARSGDQAAAGRLLERSDALHRKALPWLFRAPGTEGRWPGTFDAWLRENAVFVAEHAGSIVGIAHGGLRDAPELPIFVPRRRGVIDGLVVDPGWRRRGVGKRLVEAFEAWAHAEGAPSVELNVYEFNDGARRFYEALGYAPLRRTLRKPFPPED